MNLEVKRLDHLGIIAGIIKDLGIINYVDQRLKSDVRNIVTIGESVAAMIVNGLGFTTKPLSLTPEFFEDKPLDLLFGKDIQAEYFNRSKLGRVLDSIFDYGCSNLFFEVANQVCLQEKIDVRFNSLDTTTISVDGEYQDEDERAVHIAHGFSKDHRPDLKQVVQELLVSQDGGVPLAMRTWNGNASDNEIFKQRSHELISKFNSSETPRYLIADSKLYTKNNSENLKHLSFITRIPRSIKEEILLVNQSFSVDYWVNISSQERYQEHNIMHNDIQQRWIVVESQAAKKRALSQINKQVLAENQVINKFKQIQAKQSFGCLSDAKRVVKELIKNINYHKITEEILPFNIENQEKYRITVIDEKLTNVINEAIAHRSCYTIGTNIKVESLSAEQVVAAYKGQNTSVENHAFRFLKDPIFFTSSLFLKKNSRIEALLCIMTLSLLVYSIAQRRARNALQESGGTVPNQIKKPTSKPTARWLLFLLKSVNIVKYKLLDVQKTIIEGLTDLKKYIAGLFGETVKNMYCSYTEAT